MVTDAFELYRNCQCFFAHAVFFDESPSAVTTSGSWLEQTWLSVLKTEWNTKSELFTFLVQKCNALWCLKLDLLILEQLISSIYKLYITYNIRSYSSTIEYWDILRFSDFYLLYNLFV